MAAKAIDADGRDYIRRRSFARYCDRVLLPAMQPMELWDLHFLRKLEDTGFMSSLYPS